MVGGIGWIYRWPLALAWRPWSQPQPWKIQLEQQNHQNSYPSHASTILPVTLLVLELYQDANLLLLSQYTVHEMLCLHNLNPTPMLLLFCHFYTVCNCLPSDSLNSPLLICSHYIKLHNAFINVTQKQSQQLKLHNDKDICLHQMLYLHYLFPSPLGGHGLCLPLKPIKLNDKIKLFRWL